MRTEIRIFWSLALTLFCLQMGASSAGERDAARGEDFSGVDYRDGLLKVSVENQKFQGVMDEVAQKAGIRIVVNDPADESLTVDFRYLPLEKGLKRLLRGRNYVFFYLSEEGSNSMQPSKLIKVLIFPKSWQGIMAGLGETNEKQPADQAAQRPSTEEMLNLDLERPEEAVEVFSQLEIDLTKAFDDVLKRVGTQRIEDLMKSRQFEEETVKALFQDGGDLSEGINKALEGLRGRTTGINPGEGGEEERQGNTVWRGGDNAKSK